MDLPKCSKCNDTLWVCENHSDQPFDQCEYCDGAGIPCECNEEIDNPPGFEEIKEVH